MSAIQVSFVIPTKDPFKLACFYQKISGNKALAGLNSDHYFISLSNGTKINFFKPKKRETFLNREASTSLCFEQGPTIEPNKVLNEWSSKLIQFGANSLEKAREEFFGAEMWMEDPEGNHFLLLVTCESLNS